MTNANSAAHPDPADTQKLTLKRLAYGVYAWIEFTLMALLGVSILLILPGLMRRRRFVRRLARFALRLAGMPLTLTGAVDLPTPCILVANHCSYIDGVVLTATLPPSFSFVIKREMSHFPLAGTLLRRIGSEFVERRDRRVGARDTRRLLRSAASGNALAFFPEGTFSEEVGLLKFHIGAFAAAARARLPVVPVVIRGTRRSLPAGSAWPNPGRIHVEILGVVPAMQSGESAEDGDLAIRLRDMARGRILSALNEPDLATGQA
ncbi:MAG TPA: lysophospholipid acyltransferase family protein [Steroidobacteraceae bacterium]|jgi:1-acyl-sn-glycerol-3-phosphate acyltransferase|nr:lysophospholipid acyltransferase family protein [Steroidobacteraceae bacterium]